jgi:hypothetical protein
MDVVIQDWRSNRDDEKTDQGQFCNRNVKWVDIWEETLGATGMQQQHKELRPKRVITTEKQENTQQDLKADQRAGDSQSKQHLL